MQALVLPARITAANFPKPEIFSQPRFSRGALPLQTGTATLRSVLSVENEDAAQMVKERREQVSITLEPKLLAVVERVAEQEHRTLSGQVRHFVAKAVEEHGARAA